MSERQKEALRGVELLYTEAHNEWQANPGDGSDWIAEFDAAYERVKERLAAETPKRKVVQITADMFPLGNGANGNMLIALCADGSMWYRTLVGGKWLSWHPIPGPP